MKLRRFTLAVVVLHLAMGTVVLAEPSGLTETRGLRCISSEPFPAPEGTVTIAIPGADFETAGKTLSGWDIQGGRIIVAADVPQGKAYCQIKAGKGGILRTPANIAASPGRPYFLSMCLKSPSEYWAVISFTSDEHLRTFGAHHTSIPLCVTASQHRRSDAMSMASGFSQ